ncbi:Calpain-5 [Lamellibrachia satsuma]|nr:Calpain-5 [Lamellibrachia satsuma]
MAPSVVAHRSQRYNVIKKELVKRGEIFVDNEFPANSKSLFFSRVCNDVEWKRPQELCKVPKLSVDGSTCSDLSEGELGNRWFVAACCSLAREPRLWQKVVPNHMEQEWEPDATYTGIFHFQFWRCGHWVDVVVNDELPTRDGRLLFCQSQSTNEFWPALLEKAYAKLYGDYESLNSCCTVDALVDFTGGVAQKYLIDELDIKWDINRVRLFQELQEALENKALLTCSIKCERETTGDVAEEGLIKGNGYSVTAIRVIHVQKDLREMVGTPELFIVRLRNATGKKQWNGDWSDTSRQWTLLSTKDREKFGLTFEQENDFWMSFDDFAKYFTNVDICHFFNTTFFTVSKTWCEATMAGEWTAGAKGTHKDRAGGSDKNNTFLQNHQVENNRKYRVHVVGGKILASQHLCSRNVFKKVVLKRGRYVVIPSTLHPGVEGKFLLRIYTSCIACARKAAQKVEPLVTGFGLASDLFPVVLLLYQVRIRFVPSSPPAVPGSHQSSCCTRLASGLFPVVLLLYQARIRFVPGSPPAVPGSHQVCSRQSSCCTRLASGLFPVVLLLYQARIRLASGLFPVVLLLYQARIRPLTKECPCRTSCMFVKRVSVVSQITIIDADGLEQGNGIDTYVVVKCEGETVKSHWLKNVCDPKWNFKAIFYRKQPTVKPVTVEIWSRRLLVDTLLATTSISDCDTSGCPVVKVCSLYKKAKTQKYMQLPGSLRVQLTSSDDLCAL